jgi:hypothetical protein
MLGELLIITIGFFNWLLKGCKTDLYEEIYGKKHDINNTRAKNYFLGTLLLIILIVVFMLV